MKDHFHLARFIEAQSRVYRQALDELAAGSKRTHWMWFVFPQIEGLGSSPTARHFAISGLAEALAYLEHPLLGSRLLECTTTVNGLGDGLTAREIFSSPDDLKFRSSMTLFSHAATQGGVDSTPFQMALKRYFGGKPDLRTLELLKPAPARAAALTLPLADDKTPASVPTHHKEMMMENYIWLFATAGGAAILGLALAYGLSSQRKLSRTEKQRQDEKVEDLYNKR